MNDARLRLFELAAEAAFLIATAPDPALARQKFNDDLTEELIAGRKNLEGSGPLREAFRAAMGYSVRVPDALGEQETTGSVDTGSCSPSALSGRDGDLTATDGPPEPVVACPGHTGPSRPPNALRLVRGDA